MRIFFTGGSDKAGKHVAAHLAEQGHQVTNADPVVLEHPDVADLQVDSPTSGRPTPRWPGSRRWTSWS